MPIVGLAEVLVEPVYTGVQRKIGKEIGPAVKGAGRSVGKTMGEAIANGLAEETPAIEAEVAKYGKAVSDAEAEATAARKKAKAAAEAEATALGSLRVAQAKLQSAYASGSKEQQQAVAALAKEIETSGNAVEAARRKATAATDAESRAVAALGVAQQKLTELRDKDGVSQSRVLAATEKVNDASRKVVDTTNLRKDAVSRLEMASQALSAAEARSLQDIQRAAAGNEQVVAAVERLNAARTRAANAAESTSRANEKLSSSNEKVADASRESGQAQERLNTHLKEVRAELERNGTAWGRLSNSIKTTMRGRPMGEWAANVARDSNQISNDLDNMSHTVEQSGTRGGRAFSRGFLLINVALAGVVPVAGAASSSLVGASGAVTTLAASLSQLGGVAALAPAALVSVGAAAGVLRTAFMGMGEALTTALDSSDRMATMGQNPRIAAMAVEDAMRSITRAEETAAEARVTAGRRVGEAQRDLADAQENAASANIDAARRVTDAQQSLADVQENVAKAGVQASRRVEEAQRNLADVQESVALAGEQAARRVQDAQQDLTDSVEEAAKANEQAARRVTDAQRSLSDAVEASAKAQERAARQVVAANRRVEDAARRLADAQRALQDAVESVAESREDASRRIEMAERREAKAARDVLKAQKELNEVRKEAVDRVQEVAEEIEKAQLKAREAALALSLAETNLAKGNADPASSQMRIDQLDLMLARAQQADAAARGTLSDLTSEQEVAKREAVTASEAVLEAEQRLADARQSQADAAYEAKEAREDAVKAERDGARQIEDAQRSITNAIESQTEALRERQEAYANVVEAEKQGARAIADAQRNVADAMAAAAETGQDGARRIADAQQSLADAQRESTKATRDGARSIADAQQAVIDAQQEASDASRDGARSIAEAQQSVIDAQQEATEASRDGARSIADAQQAVVDAVEAGQKSQRDAALGLEDAYRNLERVQLQQAESAKQGGDEAATAMSKLSPAAQLAAAAILEVIRRLQGVREIAQENFFTGLVEPFYELADIIIPQLEAGVGRIATAFNGAALQLMNSLGTALGGGVLESLLNSVATQITILSTAIDPLVQSFVTLASIGMPYMEQLAQWIADAATEFNTFIQGAAADGSLNAWIDAGIKGFQDIGSILSSAKDIFTAFNDAARAGGIDVTLASVADAMNRLQTIMEGPVFQDTMTTIFAGAKAGMEGLASGGQLVADAFVKGADAFAEFQRLGGEITGMFVGGVFQALSDPAFGAGLTGFLENVRAGVEKMMPMLPGLMQALGEVMGELGPLVREMGPTLVEVFTFFAEAIANVMGVLEPLLEVIAGSPLIIGLLIAAFVGTSAASAGLTAAANLNKIASAALWVTTGLLSIAQGVLASAFSLSTKKIASNDLAMKAHKVTTGIMIGLQKAWAAATAAATAVQKGLNAAMKANPIGMIITAIGLLVAGLIWFFTQTELGREIWANVWGFITETATNFSRWWTEDFIPGILRYFEELPGKLGQIGKDLIMGLLNGITGGNAEMMLAEIGILVDRVIKWFKELFGIHSPSTVFAEIGKFLIQGLLDGINGMIQFVKDVWNNMITFVRDVFEGVAVWLLARIEIVKLGWSIVWTAIRDKITEIWNAVSTFIRDTLQAVADFIRTRIDLIKLGWSIVWTAIKDKVTEIWNAVSTFIRNTLQAVVDFIRDRIENMKRNWAWVFETVRDKATEIWNAINTFIRNVLTAVVDFIRDRIENMKRNWTWVFETIRDTFNTIWNRIREIVKDILSNVVTWVRDKIDELKRNWDRIWDAVKTKLSDIWNGIRDVIRDTWNFIRDNVISPMLTFVRDEIPKAFEKAKDGIATAWNKIKEIAKKPVRFVVDKVINEGLINTFNKIPGVNLGPVELPKDFGGYAVGGKIKGHSPTSTADNILIRATANEFMVRQRSAIKLENEHPGALDYINKYGKIPGIDGYATGGFIWPVGRQYPITQYPSGGHRAYDIGTPEGTPVKAVADGRVSHAGPGYSAPGVWGGTEVHVDHGGGIGSLFAHLSSLLVRVGDIVKQNQTVALSGNTGISSGAHLHFGGLQGGMNMVSPDSWLNGAIPKGDYGGVGGGGGGEGPPPEKKENPFVSGVLDGMMDLIKKQFPESGMFVDVAGGALKKGVENITTFINDVKNNIGKIAGHVVDKIKDFFGAGNMAIDRSSAAPMIRDTGGYVAPGLNSVLNKAGQYEYINSPADMRVLHHIAKQGGAGGQKVYNVQLPQQATVSDLITAVNFEDRRAARGGRQR